MEKTEFLAILPWGNFQKRSSDYIREHFHCYCLYVNGTGPYRWKVNVGSGNGLELSGNKH